jgi:hypothetical protein
MLYFMFMSLLIVAIVAPIVVITVTRVVPRVVDKTVPPIVDRFVSGVPPELEARLTRIEEAIEAIAVEVERLRTGDLQSYEPPPKLGAAPQGEGAGSES